MLGEAPSCEHWGEGALYSYFEIKGIFIGARGEGVGSGGCPSLHNSWSRKNGRDFVQDLQSVRISLNMEIGVLKLNSCSSQAYLMMFQLRPLLIRIHILRIPRSRQSCATLTLQLDLDPANGCFGRKIENDLAGEKVKIGIVFVLAIQQDRCGSGHGGGRPSVVRGVGLALEGWCRCANKWDSRRVC